MTDRTVPHLHDPIARYAQTSPERPAVITGERTWTYRQLDGWITSIEHRLLGIGCAPETVIAIEAPKTVNTVALLWAVWRIGGIACPLNTRHPAERLLTQSRRVGADLLVAHSENVVTQALNESMRAVALDSLSAEPGETPALGEASEMRPTHLPLDARATGVFTSGSTGRPKIAVHTLGNHVYSARGSAENIPLGLGDTWLASLPLYHVGGLAILFRTALAGAAIAMPNPEASFSQAVIDFRPTHVSMVATQLRRLLDAPTESNVMGSVSAALIGGSAIPAEFLDRAVSYGWPVHTSYGSTEMSSQITTTPPAADRKTLATSGFLLPHRELEIREGAIYVRGRTLFAGYATNAGATGELDDARTTGGWFATGDLGYLDDNGRLCVTGRADRLIISGGENIQPEEIEKELERLEGVRRAAVVGVPDEEFGRRPVAFVRWDSGADRRDLVPELRGVLPGYKIPDAIHVMPDSAVAQRMKVDYEVLEAAARKLR
ncbi:o-succinylbenzoate--CoA ligase [Longibacter salinarum]|uniref:o-succinylbenzoate--CoA ligase n=1 Tax=Longibacter salinarum TaxID=1850348 RepID=UPI0015CF1137|nr:o-succinylbenzoate--CoA ligase [Longibacter salinarum]